MNTKKAKKTNKAKPPGTVLNGRYELYEPIGRGGFSIVYEAEDRQSGQKVAVKECTILSEKYRFLREAKLLEEYSEEDAIVRVLDFFEENDTAYIVMEFLEGKNLRECIEKDGKWTMEETVQRMAPVMETLEHMHRNNVIHRDISPDNIMVLKDGKLKLLDFGAAKQYEDSTLSRFVVKANYSPPEQMDTKGMFGSWSDVYSICAAMYFCITGRNPEDAITRLMMDDLKMPSELGADILHDADRILMSGMELDSSKRIRDMRKLRAELESVYPLLSEEEKLAQAKRKKRKKLLLAFAALAVLIVSASLLHKYIPIIALNFDDNETFVLDGRNMTEEEFRENAEKAKHLMNILSDGKFSCVEGERSLNIKIPSDIFGERIDAEEGVNCLISAPMKFYAEGVGSEFFCDLNQSEDISDAYLSDSGEMSIEFTDAGQKKLKSYTGRGGEHLRITGTNDKIDEAKVDASDKSTDYDLSDYCSFYGSITTDGKKFDSSLDDKTLWPYAKAIFTLEPLSAPFTVIRKWNIEWEDPSKTEAKGAGQLSEKELDSGIQDGEKLRLKYSYKPYVQEEEEKEIKDEDIADLQNTVKSRLDILGIPFAVGRDKDEKGSMIVEIPAGSINYETASVLGSFISFSFNVGGSTDKFLGSRAVLTDAELIEDGADMYPALLVSEYSSQEDIDKMNAYFDMLRDRGEKYLYLKYEELPVARTDIEQAASAVKKGENVEFREWCAAEGKESELKDFIRFIRECSYHYDQNEVYFLTGMQSADNNGGLHASELRKDGLLLSDQTAEKYIEEWRARYGDRLKFGKSNFSVDYASKIKIVEAASDMTDEESVKMLCDFLKDNKDKLMDGTFKNISYEAKAGSVVISINEAGDYYASSINGYLDEEAEKYIKESISKNKDLKFLLTDETDYWHEI